MMNIKHDGLNLLMRAFFLRIHYFLVRFRLRREYKKRKIRVGFLVSEIAKWKGQSLYDFMSHTSDFEPIMLVYPSPREIQEGNANRYVSEKVDYFRKSEMTVQSIWNSEHSEMNSIESLHIDILFYQQPWDIPPALGLMKMAKTCLTFYFPYYVLNNFSISGDLYLSLHYCLYRYVLLNDYQVKLFQSYSKRCHYAGKMVGLGHPALDEFYLKKNQAATKNYVIYAPHFSFKCDGRSGRELPFYSSTFLELGRVILDFAKSHPEINWVFKPHPRLRTELTDYEVWTKEEVDEYYEAWEKIGLSCFDSHYAELFLESKAMITDCNSFLTEYGCTGKPLIRLIPDNGASMPPPNPALKNLYDSFYKVYNEADLFDALNFLLVKNEDPNKKERLKQVEDAHLAGNYAAQNITNYIRTLLCGNSWRKDSEQS